MSSSHKGPRDARDGTAEPRTGRGRTDARREPPRVSEGPPRSQTNNRPGGAAPLPPRNLRIEYWLIGGPDNLTPGKSFEVKVVRNQLRLEHGFQVLEIYMEVVE